MTDFGQYCCHDSLSELLPTVLGGEMRKMMIFA